MKKLFNLKMVENASVAQHLNEFNTITNQLSSVEIDFDYEIRALIVLASRFRKISREGSEKFTLEIMYFLSTKE